MSKEIENEDGAKEIVYSQEEYTKMETDLKSLQTELEDVKKVNAEKTDNFKAFSKMTEEEKKVYDANTINLLKREEALTNQIGELTTKLSEKEQKEATSAKETAFKSVHLGNEDAKKVLEEKYALLSGMPESTAEEIGKRVLEAAKLAGIQIDTRNPLFQAFNGESPSYKKGEEFTDTQKGKMAMDAARVALGLPTDNK